MLFTNRASISNGLLIGVCTLIGLSFSESHGQVGDKARVWLGCAYFNNFSTQQQCDSSSWYGRAVQDGIALCKTSVSKPICREMVRDDQNLASGLRKCDTRSVCQHNSFSAENLDFKKCREGYILGTGELLVGLGESLRHLGVGTMNLLRNNIQDAQAREKYLRGCTTLSCKIQVAREIHPALGITRFPELETKITQSEKYSAIWIETERQRLEANYFRQTRNLAPKSLGQLAQEAESHAIQQDQSEIPGTESEIFKSALRAIEKKIEGLECFDAATQAQLICWGAAYIVDPTIVAGAAAKGAVLARLVSKKMAESTVTAESLKVVRKFRPQSVGIEKTLGKVIAEIPIKGIPPSMRILKYQNELGEEVLALERAVTLPNGEVKKSIRELPLDPMTGTFDANFPVAREFLEKMVRDLNGKVTLAVVDIDNLGYVSRNFTHGFRGHATEMKSHSMQIGDQYVRAVARALKEVVGENGQIWRTGGDEFAVVLLETDPLKAKMILDQISRRVREGDARAIFVEESRARARVYRQDTTAGTANPADFRLNYAPYSQPNVSIGSVVVNNESVTRAFALAERQASAHKMSTKEQFAADTTKYGGVVPAPDAIPHLNFVAPAAAPAIGVEISAKNSQRAAPTLKQAQGTLAEARSREVFRVGEYSIVEYRSEVGEAVLRGEHFFSRADGARSFTAPELFLNSKTGLLDGRHARTRAILETFARSERTPHRGAIWINAENLGLANNFADGGISVGDRLLNRTAAILKEVSDQNRIPVKLTGSEFLLLTENIPSDQLRGFTQRLQSKLANDAEIKGIYDAQEAILRQRLEHSRNGHSPNSAVQNAQAVVDKFMAARDRLFSLHETAIQGSETLAKVLERTRGQRYAD